VAASKLTRTKLFLIDLAKGIDEDDIFTGAAALTYYLILSIFPAILFLLNLLPFLPIPDAAQSMVELSQQLLPRGVTEMFTNIIDSAYTQYNPKLLIISFVATVWTAAVGMHTVIQQLNKSYRVKEARTFFLGRGVAILLSFAFGVLVLTSLVLIVFGGIIQNFIASFVDSTTLNILFNDSIRWAIAILFLFANFSLIYRYGPNHKQKGHYVVPGSVVAVLLLVVTSLGFNFYVENYGNYTVLYGNLGALITLMLWLYMSGLAILIGAKVNALLEKVKFEPKTTTRF